MSDETKDRRTTLVDRLRGIYTTPVDDGAGLLDGKDTFTVSYEPTPINLEAADEIERLKQLVLDNVKDRNIWRGRAIHLGWRGEG